MAWGEQLPSGRWRGRYRVGGKTYILERDDGSPWTFTSKAAAKREAAAKETNMRQPGAILPGSGRITWGEWREEWWPKHCEKVAANSVSSYASKIKHHIAPHWDVLPLDEHKQTDDHTGVQEWVSGLDLAPASVHVVYSLYSASMRAAVIAKKISASPCVGITLPPIVPPGPRFLTSEEFDTLLIYLGGEFRMLALIAVGTGMRWGEVVGLHWEDVHAKTVRIRCAYSREGRHMKLPKGKRVRTVPLAPWLGAELATWRESVESGRSCNVRHHRLCTPCRSGLVLPGTQGCLSYSTCERNFVAAVALAKLGRTTMHDLRDTYASRVLQAGFTIEQVAELLGDRDIKLVRERYAEFGSSQFDAIAAAVPAPVLPQRTGEKITDLAERRRSRTS